MKLRNSLRGSEDSQLVIFVNYLNLSTNIMENLLLTLMSHKVRYSLSVVVEFLAFIAKPGNPIPKFHPDNENLH